MCSAQHDSIIAHYTADTGDTVWSNKSCTYWQHMQSRMQNTHTHTLHYTLCNDSITHITLHLAMCLWRVYIGSRQSWQRLQISGWMFQAVGPHQCSAVQQNSYQTTQSHTMHAFTNTHWIIQPLITGLPSDAHTIPTHAHTSRAIHTAPLAYHTHVCTSTCSICTHSVSHANAI